MDRGAWQTTVYAAAESQTRLNEYHFHFSLLCLRLLAILTHTEKETPPLQNLDPSLVPGVEFV